MDKKEAKIKIEKLRQEINKYRYSYHVLDKSLIPDAALDSLKNELTKLEARFPELITADSPTQRVAGKPLKKFEKVRHERPMLSFNDAFSREDMDAWFTRAENFLGKQLASGEKTFYCELKIDGLALELIYENGVLVKGATRGDGQIGEDITQNIKTVEAIPLRIDTAKFPGAPERLVVRGEVFMTKREFNRANREQEKKGEKVYANPRNIAAGSIRQLDPAVTAGRKLDSFEYGLLFSPRDVEAPRFVYHSDEHELLHRLGFKTNPNNKICKSLKEVFEFHDYWEKHRDKLPYEIDGIVVIINRAADFEAASVIGKAPRGAIAYKFSAREATTAVEDITVSVGRTGVLTPVAVLSPVSVGGVTITHATLHNADEIGRLGLKIGDTVIVSRAGDVIPKIQKVLPNLRTGQEKNFYMPSTCPVDGSPVTRDGVAYKCSNQRCGARNREGLYHFVSRGAFNLDGMGPKIIDRFLDEGLITDAADIFRLKSGDIAALPRFGDKSAENIVNEAELKKKIPLPRFIYSLSIIHVGEETARRLAEQAAGTKIKTPDELGRFLGALSKEDLEKISDVGPKVAESIYEWFHEKRNVEFLKRLTKVGVELQGQKPSAKYQKLSGKTFVLTGTLAGLSRDEAKEKIRALGGDISESVSKKTDFVVVGAEPGSKFETAKKLSVKILEEKELLDLLRQPCYFKQKSL